MSLPRTLRASRGSAAVELIAVAPLLALLALAGCQLAYAGYADWQLHQAARDAARSSVVVGRLEGNRAAQRAADKFARGVLGGLSEGLRLTRGGDGRVRARLPMPLLGPFRSLSGVAPPLTAAAGFGP